MNGRIFACHGLQLLQLIRGTAITDCVTVVTSNNSVPFATRVKLSLVRVLRDYSNGDNCGFNRFYVSQPYVILKKQVNINACSLPAKKISM